MLALFASNTLSYHVRAHLTFQKIPRFYTPWLHRSNNLRLDYQTISSVIHSILLLEPFFFISFTTLNVPCFLYTVGISATLMKFWFIMQAIRHEAFTHMEGQKEFVQIDQHDLFPYLLVNIGSGVSIIKVMYMSDIHCTLSPCLMDYFAAS